MRKSVVKEAFPSHHLDSTAKKRFAVPFNTKCSRVLVSILSLSRNDRRDLRFKSVDEPDPRPLFPFGLAQPGVEPVAETVDRRSEKDQGAVARDRCRRSIAAAEKPPGRREPGCQLRQVLVKLVVRLLTEGLAWVIKAMTTTSIKRLE